MDGGTEGAGMTVTVLEGDCRDVLATLPDASVQCVVTSPPYYGLRDYGTATWEGGDAACAHQVGEIRTGLGLAALGERYAGGGHKAGEPKPIQARDVCPHCGAKRIDKQIGLEKSPEEYVAGMVAVFREVRRVLRDDGTLWLNIGDSYASSPPGIKSGGVSASSGLNGVNGASGRYRETLAAGHATKRDTTKLEGIKPKDLLGIRWMLAFALRADGWYLRSEIIWHKPNPMPESVADRPTKAHEQVFLLSKLPSYFYDADAIREEGVIPAGTKGAKGSEARAAQPGVNSRPPEYKIYDGMRNARSVWTIATRPFTDAHFATMPPELAERCIKAGSKPNDTVLDPFGGAGTTGLVADRLGRDALLIELNPTYADMARERIRGDAPLLGSVA